ncbi:hypothetical protein [Nissabacter sp. SGAir0207]|uniref:hypothetical protein n=1 Tax=Nissabacter sp. SGAir0207 TaxID=2126321 RepID=UPI0010CD53E5|nr:hypothetical protein [Nissabacter sp. SGAir0207]QCR38803.1 hypothetical protein C1N62_22020 [Nissabacter sp. SGAir0207]
MAPARVRDVARQADHALLVMGEEGRAKIKRAYQEAHGLPTGGQEPTEAEQGKQAEDAKAVAAALAKTEAEAEERHVVDGLQTETGITVRVSTGAVRSKRGINFAAGGCFGLQDPKGKEGALYRSKDELKEKYGAKFFNGTRPGSEFAGSWWLIPSRYDREEVLKVVSRY